MSDERHDDGEELASKVILCELKRVWVDLKSNHRGKFLKISEQDSTGNRQKINVPLSGAARFRDVLSNLAKLDASLGPVSEEAQQQAAAAAAAAAATTTEKPTPSPPIKTETLRTENKMFYFDLRQNARGRFLKISQVMGQRAAIVVPARGIAQLRDAVEEVCKVDPQASLGLEPVPTIPADQLPQPAQINAEQKRFFFDVGSNSRGVFLRVSEVVGSYRTAITIPRSAWPQFRDTFQKYLEKIDDISATDGSAADLTASIEVAH